MIEGSMKAGKILDSIMHNIYFDNPVKLAEWKASRHIKNTSKKKEQPPTS